ncbi:hypothetical protein F4780DRAFT_785368 [Xylariomycetidae sp. FL0641]|nr:hypothetical protein F4780DRAFT_785368 [Xylariomycetidae sp. FL0641]
MADSKVAPTISKEVMDAAIRLFQAVPISEIEKERKLWNNKTDFSKGPTATRHHGLPHLRMRGTIKEHLDTLNAEELKEIILRLCHADPTLNIAIGVKNAARTIISRADDDEKAQETEEEPAPPTPAEQPATANASSSSSSTAKKASKRKKKSAAEKAAAAADKPRSLPPCTCGHHLGGPEDDGHLHECKWCARAFLPAPPPAAIRCCQPGKAHAHPPLPPELLDGSMHFGVDQDVMKHTMKAYRESAGHRGHRSALTQLWELV